MSDFIESLNAVMSAINGVLWHDIVLYIILFTGIAFLFWSKFSPLFSLTHGTDVVRGKFDHSNDPGAISHFQALSAALSATVGLGNIGGVAVAISLGGPGAVFWMWIVGLVGMAIKTTEVTQAMLYRDTYDSDNPHGGPMYVASRGLAAMNPSLAGLGKGIGIIFCITLLISTATGGNMFQAWNVGEVTKQNFGVPTLITGFILAVICATVIIGGIKRIGAVAGKLVPFMCGVYLVAALYVIILNIGEVPSLLMLIVSSAFSPVEAQGAFLGGTAGYAFLWGMKRALFSNEAGQGSAPIAHAAARTDEPVREGVVAGLEPFIDTIVVCTLTALVILASGAWNRGPAATFSSTPALSMTAENSYTLTSATLSPSSEGDWVDGQSVFTIIKTEALDEKSGTHLHKVYGNVALAEDGSATVNWKSFNAIAPEIIDASVYTVYTAASLTSHAFDRVNNGLGRWLVTFAAWLFAISTMISWSYYGETGVVFVFGDRWVTSYKIIYCLLIVVATSGFITTDRELDNLTGIGTGVMLFANIPIMWIFGAQAMKAYHGYKQKFREGKFQPTDS